MATDAATGHLVINATLLRDARQRGGGQLVIVPAGAGPEPAVVEIVEQLGMSGTGSSLVEGNVRSGSRVKTKHTRVAVAKIDDVAAAAGVVDVFLFKMDVQGFEIAALDGGRETAASAKYAHLEFAPRLLSRWHHGTSDALGLPAYNPAAPWTAAAHLLRELRRCGFFCFQIPQTMHSHGNKNKRRPAGFDGFAKFFITARDLQCQPGSACDDMRTGNWKELVCVNLQDRDPLAALAEFLCDTHCMCGAEATAQAGNLLDQIRREGSAAGSVDG